MTTRTTSAPDHDALYRLAEAQAGYFTTQQAEALGFTRALLVHHVRSGQFQRIKHGVYRLARFPEMPHADLMVAHLDVGPQSVISHESALALYDLSDVLPGAVHLTIPRTSSRRHPGLHLHTRRLIRADITQRAGLPVTTVPRTIADLIAGGRSEQQIRQAIQEALQRGLVTRQTLIKDTARRSGRVANIVRHALEEQAAQ
jgi:predicted transcriptional regulator of viral defense system